MAATDLLKATSLPALPGSLWAMLSRLSWADPDIIRPHLIPIEAQIAGAAAVAGVGVDGPAVAADNQVVAKSYFLVERIEGYVERDPGNPLEDESAYHVALQIEDDARQFPLGRVAFNMGPIAGTKDKPGRPVDYTNNPLAFLPNSDIVANFTPLAGFTNIASAVTGLATRRVGIHLHGMLVDARIVENLLDLNDAALRAAGLRRKRT